MEGSALSTAHVDYLQRAGVAIGPPGPEVGWTLAAPELRRLSRVCGVGTVTTDASRGPPGGGAEAHPADDALLIGLHSFLIPVAFLLVGDPSGIRVHVGTWSPPPEPGLAPAPVDARLGIIASALHSQYPVVDLQTPDSMVDLRSFPCVGIAVGVPGLPDPQDPPEAEAPLDRLVRAMGDARWAALVLAQPVDEAWAIKLRRTVINEIRATRTAEQDQLAPSPLAKHYAELLEVQLKALTVGHAVGMWRTSVALFGDPVSFYRLSSLWRATFANERSLPEPLRVIDCTAWPPPAPELLASWGMPDSDAPAGPGVYHRPLEHQTLLHSVQLARYLHLPREETPGFAITLLPKFDVTAPPVDPTTGIDLGVVLQRNEPTGAHYAVRPDNLTRHALVAGVTGSGKTNTLFHLLEEATRHGVPFLTIEPAKTEYRALLAHPDIGPRLRVFTAGEEQVSPLRLNPFEVPAGTSVAQHLDLLRAVFNTSFAMWAPLPQVLEQCLHEVYLDHGWDLTRNANPRLDDNDDLTPAFPTLTELIAKVPEVTRRLGYEERVTADIEAALATRLESLRRGGKGRMLDTRRSIPMTELFDHPCLLELEWMGDDDDKAFLAALLLVRLAEHRRAQGETDGLRHLLILEEAHRLLAATGAVQVEDQAAPRAKAVETFTQLLSEVRAYGQGVVIADQIPIRLAPDVVKNTGLKLAHRTLAAEDRAVLAGAMAMNDDQTRALTVLRVGEAAVLGDNDDAPVLLRIPRAGDPPRPDDPTVAHSMQTWRSDPAIADAFLAAPCCAESCRDERTCELARQLTTDPTVQTAFARMVLSSFADPDALPRLWADVADHVLPRRPADVDETALLWSVAGHAADWYASHRGNQAGWSYATTNQFATWLRRALLENLAADNDPDAPADRPTRDGFLLYAQQITTRDADPYPACHLICSDEDRPCRYRHAVADLVATGRYRNAWANADNQDRQTGDGTRTQTWETCQDAGYELIEFPEHDWPDETRQPINDAARRACLCFAQQSLAANPTVVPRSARIILGHIMEEAGL